MVAAHSLDEIIHQRNSVVTVGTFDGIHLGHQKILSELLAYRNACKCRSVIVTFHPHPREIVGRGPVGLLTTLEERLHLFETYAVDLTLIIDFTFEFSRQTSLEFYERYVVKGIGVTEVIVGYDHMFGRDREAGVKELEKMGETFGYKTHSVSPVIWNGEIVSSSKVREYLLRGQVENAEQLLNRPYHLKGVVVQGDGRGVTLGFPTANIQPKGEKKIIPAEGVYLVRIEIEGKHLYGMLNIGVRPTFTTSSFRTIEVHIFDYHDNLDGKDVTLHFLKRLRREKKFSSKEELIAQLEQDKKECIKFISVSSLS